MFRTIILAVLMTFAMFSQVATASYSNEYRVLKPKIAKLQPLIAKTATEQNASVKLITTVVFKESRFDKNAVNRQGSSAVGLMGVTKGTRKHIIKTYGSQLGLSRNADPHDAATALKLGTQYLKEIESQMSTALRRPVSDAEIYMGYYLGPYKAIRVLKSKNGRNHRVLKEYRTAATFYAHVENDMKPVIEPTPQIDYQTAKNNQAALDDVMTALYQRYNQPVPKYR